MTGETAGTWVWTPIPPLTLLANGYYSVLQETTASDGLQWSNADVNAIAIAGSEIANLYSCYRVPGGGPNANTVNAMYVGLDLGWNFAPVVNPPVMTGLVHWLDPSRLALADGAAVTTWPNLGTGAQPTFIGTPPPVFKAARLNGKGVVRFTAGQSGLRSAWSGASLDDYTLIYVVRWIGPGVGRAFSMQYPPSNFLVGMHTSAKDAMFANGSWIYGASTGWADWGTVQPWRMYGADGKIHVTSRFFIDGVVTGSPGPASAGAFASGWGLSGYDPASSGEMMDFEVAELLIYDHQLTDAERISVEAYLRTKWGLT